jgi:hypothetical protein
MTNKSTFKRCDYVDAQKMKSKQILQKKTQNYILNLMVKKIG